MEVAQAARQGGRIIQIASTERDRARDSMFGEGLSGRVCGCFCLFLAEPFFLPYKWERHSDIALLTAWGAARSHQWTQGSGSSWEGICWDRATSPAPLGTRLAS